MYSNMCKLISFFMISLLLKASINNDLLLQQFEELPVVTMGAISIFCGSISKPSILEVKLKNLFYVKSLGRFVKSTM